MQINSIGLANYYGMNSLKTQKKNPKSNNNISEPTYNNIPSLSFYGTRAKIRKPELQKEISKKSKELKTRLETLPDAWEYMTREEQRSIIADCVSEIVATENDAKIYYKFM